VNQSLGCLPSLKSGQIWVLFIVPVCIIWNNMCRPGSLKFYKICCNSSVILNGKGQNNSWLNSTVPNTRNYSAKNQKCLISFLWQFPESNKFLIYWWTVWVNRIEFTSIFLAFNTKHYKCQKSRHNFYFV